MIQIYMKDLLCGTVKLKPLFALFADFQFKLWLFHCWSRILTKEAESVWCSRAICSHVGDLHGASDFWVQPFPELVILIIWWVRPQISATPPFKSVNWKYGAARLQKIINKDGRGLMGNKAGGRAEWEVPLVP